MTPAAQIPQTILGLAPDHPTTPHAARTLKEKTMIATITIAGTVIAQGPIVHGHADGRVTIADVTCPPVVPRS